MPAAEPTMTELSLKAQPRAAAPARGAFAALVALAALAAFAVPPRLAADELRGHIQLLTKDGKSVAHDSDPLQAVVYFEPTAAGHAAKAPEAPFKLVTRRKEFIPRVLAVPVGSRVQFPNEDPILHNVFSVSPGNTFDLGIYRNGPAKEKRFDQPGLVRVFCNVHQTMVAYILVLATPFYAAPSADATFRLSGLPNGPGKLTVWHEQADPWSTELVLPLAATAPPVEARLLVVRPKLPPHLNKTGAAYNRSEDYR
jgi:plastocyanin